jgi:hypothetical protein
MERSIEVLWERMMNFEEQAGQFFANKLQRTNASPSYGESRSISADFALSNCSEFETVVLLELGEMRYCHSAWGE